ncbi:pseudouridine synthase [Quadrisphaera setariae]|uniref:Pseudouridine synthase n=1 Tax=Quadrisphaera setariae TaxID=2593304 RepID=A0A5C8ZIE8_9ACTN|nr:pseudouridine synthase [Quadrisphaera setariae]TXR56696.1 rRNA pseudouridine synthase [Quadrisphaera setariae]
MSQQRDQRDQQRSQQSGHDEHDVHDPDGVRLQKVLAGAGMGSRRACEELITRGRVRVDGKVVTELGVRVDTATAQVEVDGMLLQLDPTKVYLAMNKPRGYLSAMSDPEGRLTLADILDDRTEQGVRLFHVGRLDVDTEGLILLTNDGDLAHRLQHPSFEVPRTYVAEIHGPVERGIGKRLRDGVELEDGLAKADSFRLVDSAPGKAFVEIVLHEGRKHVVRRMLEEVGYPVIRLARTAIGPIQLGDLRPGVTRSLTREEVSSLRSAGPGSQPGARTPRPKGQRPVAKAPDRKGIQMVTGAARRTAASSKSTRAAKNAKAARTTRGGQQGGQQRGQQRNQQRGQGGR